MPDEIKRWVKLYNYCHADGDYQVVPRDVNNPYSDGHDQIGAVVALGDSIEEAIENVRDYCGQLKAFDTSDQLEALGECLKRIHAGEDEGISFPGKTPEPETVIEE